jgi:TolB-like protein
MKRIATLVVCCSVLMVAPQASEARRRSRTRVALVPLSASGRGAAKVAWKTTRATAKKMRRNRRVRVVVLNRRRAKRMQRCLQVPRCVQLVARKLRVKYLVTGQVSRLGRGYHVDMMVVSRTTGEVISSGSYKVRSRWRAKARGARLAMRLVYKAKRGVRVAAASTTATDAVETRAPLFSRSEAESAAAIIEERDQENPLTPGEEKQEPEKKPATTVASVQSPDLTPTAERAAPAEVVVNKEPGLASRLFSGRYVHAWSVAAAGVATLGAGLAFGVTSAKANAAAQEAEYQREAWLQRDKAQKNALTANILYGVGAAAVTTSVILFYLEHSKESKELRNNKQDLSLEFQVAQKGGGVVVKGSF